MTRARRRSPLTWRAPALAGLLALVTAGSLLNAQLLTAGAWLDDHDRSRGIARTERATFNRGRILSADGLVLAATVGSGVDATRHGTSTGLPVGDFRPSRKDTDGTGLENTWALQLECGTRPEEGLAGPRGLLGQRCQPADVRTSYNAEIQEAAVRALAEAKQAAPGARGAVVALDPRTGGVLAIAADDGLATTVTGDASQPGSVFKIVTAAAIDPAGLNDLPLAPHTSLPLPDGHSLRNFGGDRCPARDMIGIPALVDALRQSCNTAFALIGEDLGPERITQEAAAFGFRMPGTDPAEKPDGAPACRTLGLEPIGKDHCDLDGLPVAVSSIESHTGDDRSCLPQQMAIGQACVYATPLQMALVAAAVAEGGRLRPPHIVEQGERDGTVLWKEPAGQPRPVIPPENAEMIRTGMVEAVKAGTAKRAAVPCAQVAAKTGTPETGPASANPDTNAWMVAFAPAEKPEVVVAVYLKAPAGGHLTGGANAAPAAATTLRTALVALKWADRC
ncbi:penicillin-binding transpeptidase domain-containing protein [Parafrankia sp. EUN1f]|uniref:penicillin-binding transpeptidase domain-containing protein n=1 Tax=Parafrankia sp. EUN1f TaxID=102897 RepID=UPI0001C44DE9|nr:penicillin-binding transpeptidase domain-containing protein [Parafrankia sp. EUN1f]EFC84386.1 penicillin-binding protein transpeptidase [Parafrankia sp. EUN1f]